MLEEGMIKDLVGLAYKRIIIRNEEELLANFRTQLNQMNEKALKGKPLTEGEFERFLREIKDKSIFRSAEILRTKHRLNRDDGSEVYLSLLNTKEWCKNIFQVTNQVEMVGTQKGIFDVTILVNSLPLVQVELKRRGVDFKEAFNQIQRYRKQSYVGLFRFVQIFVVSNGVDTNYFANSDQEIYFSMSFYWSDKNNKRITQLSEFTDDFLRPFRLVKIFVALTSTQLEYRNNR